MLSGKWRPPIIDGNESGTYKNLQQKWITKYYGTWTSAYVCDHFN